MFDDLKMCDLKIDDLYGEQQELARIIGIDAYIKLVALRGGTNVYIAKADKIQSLRRDTAIIKEFNGYNHLYLAHKYNVSDRTVRAILADARDNQLAGQISLFDE